MSGERSEPFEQEIIGTTAVQFLSASKYRRAIVIAAPNGARVSFAPNRNAVIDTLLTVSPGDQPLILSHKDFG